MLQKYAAAVILFICAKKTSHDSNVLFLASNVISVYSKHTVFRCQNVGLTNSTYI